MTNITAASNLALRDFYTAECVESVDYSGFWPIGQAEGNCQTIRLKGVGLQTGFKTNLLVLARDARLFFKGFLTPEYEPIVLKARVLQGDSVLVELEWSPDIASLWPEHTLQDLSSKGLVPQVFLGNMLSLVTATVLFLIVLLRWVTRHMRRFIKYSEIIKRFENSSKHLQLQSSRSEQ